MTPVLLDLPLRPNEAAEIAGLIFEHAERKPLSPEVRNRIAARAAALKLESIVPYFGSLSRDPVHPSAYYLAVDGIGGAPHLLYMGLASAPTSSIFHKPLLIGRSKRLNGPEFVINATPFGPAERDNIERFGARIDTAFLPRPQGARPSITVGSDYARAFEVFRAIQKRSGKNFAAVAGDYHAAVWAAIRAGWRDGYSAVCWLTPDGEPEALGYTRFAIDAPLQKAERAHERIRQARAALKVGGAFEFDVTMGRVTPEELLQSIEWLKTRGHGPQFVTVEGDVEGLAAVALQQQVTLSCKTGAGGQARQSASGSGARVAAVVRATAGRFNFYVEKPEEAELIAEEVLG